MSDREQMEAIGRLVKARKEARTKQALLKQNGDDLGRDLMRLAELLKRLESAETTIAIKDLSSRLPDRIREVPEWIDELAELRTTIATLDQRARDAGID